MGLTCMVIAVLVCGWMFWKSSQEQIRMELISVTLTASAAMSSQSNPDGYLQTLAHDSQGKLRFTWISRDGSILFESDYAAEKMENHLKRPEVQQAFSDGTGTASRDSATLDKTLYYAAQKLPDGTVLRVSAERDSLYSQFFALLPVMILLFILIGVGCARISRRLTINLLSPLRRTAQFMNKIGTPSAELIDDIPAVYDELAPLVRKIMDQSNYINHTIQTLEQERNTIRLIMEHLEEGVVLTDSELRVLAVNHCAVDMLGIEDDKHMLDRQIQELLPEADWTQLSPLGTNEIRSLKGRLNKRDRLYQMTMEAIYKQGTLYGALFILYDVTESDKREQLRREFTSNVSHELKTPLTSISGFAEMLAAGMYTETADVRHFGELIQRESQHLLQIIENIIHLTRIEEKKMVLDDQPVQLKCIIENIVDFIEPVLKKKKVTVHLTLQDEAIQGNSVMLRELGMNLIDNAVKYNRPGGHVYVSLQGAAGDVVLTVSDTGIGIPEDKQKQVFERFYRADASRARRIGGSGLGLSIVKHIVEQHGGRISLKSKEGEGTQITVYLPKGRA